MKAPGLEANKALASYMHSASLIIYQIGVVLLLWKGRSEELRVDMLALLVFLTVLRMPLVLGMPLRGWLLNVILFVDFSTNIVFVFLRARGCIASSSCSPLQYAERVGQQTMALLWAGVYPWVFAPVVLFEVAGRLVVLGLRLRAAAGASALPAYLHNGAPLYFWTVLEPLLLLGGMVSAMRVWGRRARLVALASAQRQEALASTEAALEKLSHEFRAPMLAVLSSVELLQARRALGPDDRAAALRDAYLGLRCLQPLIVNVLDFAQLNDDAAGPDTAAGRSTTGQPCANLHVADTLRELVARMHASARLAGQSLRIEIDPELLTVGHVCVVSARALQRTLSEVLDNALKFAQPSGPVRVLVSGGLIAGHSALAINISDNGCGLGASLNTSSSMLLFEPFVQGSAGSAGLGLGLANAKRFVAQLGGEIGFVGRGPLNGTQISIVIPVAGAVPRAAPTLPLLASLDGAPLPVMLCDDDATVRAMLRLQLNKLLPTALDKAPFMLSEVESVEALLAHCESLRARPARLPRLVCLDMNFPDGMGGLEGAVRMRALQASVGPAAWPLRIVLLSGVDPAALRAEPRMHAADRFLRKPVSAAAFGSVVRDVLAASPAPTVPQAPAACATPRSRAVLALQYVRRACSQPWGLLLSALGSLRASWAPPPAHGLAPTAADGAQQDKCGMLCLCALALVLFGGLAPACSRVALSVGLATLLALAMPLATGARLRPELCNALRVTVVLATLAWRLEMGAWLSERGAGAVAQVLPLFPVRFATALTCLLLEAGVHSLVFAVAHAAIGVGLLGLDTGRELMIFIVALYIQRGLAHARRLLADAQALADAHARQHEVRVRFATTAARELHARVRDAQALVESVRQLCEDASSPLRRLEARVSVLEGHAPDASPRNAPALVSIDELLLSIRLAVQSMHASVNSMLRDARLDAPGEPSAPQAPGAPGAAGASDAALVELSCVAVGLAPLLESTCARWQALAQERGLALSARVTGTGGAAATVVRVDAELLAALLGECCGLAIRAAGRTCAGSALVLEVTALPLPAPPRRRAHWRRDTFVFRLVLCATAAGGAPAGSAPPPPPASKEDEARLSQVRLATAVLYARMLGGRLCPTSLAVVLSLAHCRDARLGALAVPHLTQGAAPAPGRRALLVDDSAVTRKIIARTLLALGLAVVEAESGRQALALYSTTPERFDVMLLDFSMPEWDGIATLQALRAFERRRAPAAAHPPAPLPVVLCSAAVEMTRDRDRMIALGFQAVLEKPFTRASIVRALHDALGPAA